MKIVIARQKVKQLLEDVEIATEKELHDHPIDYARVEYFHGRAQAYREFLELLDRIDSLDRDDPSLHRPQ